METRIELKNIRFYAYHGVLDEERKRGNTFLVDVVLTAPLEKATETDDLNDTINYALVYELIQSEMRIPSQLLEHVAGRILRAMKKAFPTLTAVDLKLTKLNPPIEGDVPEASFIIHQTYN